jgi:hypothetical protein
MEKNHGIQINFENLMKLGFGVIDVRFKEYEITNSHYKYVISAVDSDRDEFYTQMLKTYTGKEFKAGEIEEVWIAILEHKINMSRILNRDIAIKVAAMDYVETKLAL